MNKIFSALFVLIAVVVSSHAASVGLAASVGGSIYDAQSKPSNVAVVQLGTGTGAQYDTIAIAGQNVYGPYNLSVDKSRPQFKGFRLNSLTGTLDSGDSAEVSYQLISGTTLADTAPVWTPSDTLIATGKLGNYQDISSKTGLAIVFKVKNIDATALLVQKKLKVVFQAPSTESVDTKR